MATDGINKFDVVLKSYNGIYAMSFLLFSHCNWFFHVTKRLGQHGHIVSVLEAHYPI